mgnify:CR=1 FL=1
MYLNTATSNPLPGLPWLIVTWDVFEYILIPMSDPDMEINSNMRCIWMTESEKAENEARGLIVTWDVFE